MARDFTIYQDYVPFETPIQMMGFKAIGMFPYEKAQIANNVVRVSSGVFSDVYNAIYRTGVMDNKIVVIFEDTHNFNTQSFAIQWKDGMCKMGTWEDVIGYACTPLKERKKKGKVPCARAWDARTEEWNDIYDN